MLLSEHKQYLQSYDEVLMPTVTTGRDYNELFRTARIFRIADIIGYIEVFCNFSVVDCDLLQLQQRLLPYL